MLELVAQYRSRRGRLLPWIFPVVGLALAAGWVFSGNAQNESTIRYITKPVERGNLKLTVTASGTLEPTNVVNLGTEVSGTVTQIHVDYNDRVVTGQLLASLDTNKLEAQVLASRAMLESARAKLLQATVSVRESQQELDRLNHVHKISQGRMPAKSDLEKSDAAAERAKADRTSATANVAQAEAALRLDEASLEKARIFSPIDGVVLKRNIELGQTVAATFETPVLFVIAEDLRRMELHIGVDEADVGRVAAGQKAMFSVDAYPDRQFPTTVAQVRYASSNNNGVISYETILTVANDDLALRPGMTASVEIVVQEENDLLLVPSSAFFYVPKFEISKGDGLDMPSEISGVPGIVALNYSDTQGIPQKENSVWVLEGENIRSVDLETGEDDGNFTEVKGGSIKLGDLVVVDHVVHEK